MAAVIHFIKELLHAYKSTHKCISEEECDRPVTHYDSNGNGYCDFHWEDWD